MKFQTLAASVLALGLFAPIAFASHGGPACFDNERKNSGFVDCMHNPVQSRSHSHAAAMVKVQKQTSLFTNHEDVNPLAKDLDREVRRVDEKNKRGRALR